MRLTRCTTSSRRPPRYPARLGRARHAREEVVQRVSRINGGKRYRGAGRGEDRRNVGDRQCGDIRDAFLAPGHSPAASSANANRPPSIVRRRGRAGRPRSSKRTMKKPPSASVRPPIHTPAGAEGLLKARHRRRQAAGGAARRGRLVVRLRRNGGHFRQRRRLCHRSSGRGVVCSNCCSGAVVAAWPAAGGAGMASIGIQPSLQRRDRLSAFCARAIAMIAMTSVRKSNGESKHWASGRARRTSANLPPVAPCYVAAQEAGSSSGWVRHVRAIPDRCGTGGLRRDAARTHRVERAQHPSLAPQRLVGEADDQPVRRGDRRGLRISRAIAISSRWRIEGAGSRQTRSRSSG